MKISRLEKGSFIFLCLCLCLFVIAGCGPCRQSRVSTPTLEAELTDMDQIRAQAAAQAFLNAWEMRDEQQGMALLSPRLRSEHTEEDLRFYVSGEENPRHHSYTMGEPEVLPDGRVRFEVEMVQMTVQEEWNALWHRQGAITMIRAKGGDWLVDELP